MLQTIIIIIITTIIIIIITTIIIIISIIIIIIIVLTFNISPVDAWTSSMTTPSNATVVVDLPSLDVVACLLVELLRLDCR